MYSGKNSVPTETSVRDDASKPKVKDRAPQVAKHLSYVPPPKAQSRQALKASYCLPAG
ncbi:hypothetical protein BaRGS_00005178, partial [Batillaria attramentaria]